MYRPIWFFFFRLSHHNCFLCIFNRRRYHLAPVDGGPRPLKVVIRRSRLLEDALATLVPAGGAIRGPLRIEFIDAQGMLVRRLLYYLTLRRRTYQ